MPVSLVLTVLNERQNVEQLLLSVSAQTRLPDEIVIVDGGSSDGTFEYLSQWRPPANIAMNVSRLPGASIAEGRNSAIKSAAHDWITVTDAGTTLDELWLESLVKALEGGAEVVGGFFRPLPGALVQSIIGVIITPTLDEIDAKKFLPSSRSIAFTKSAWTSVLGYPEWLDYCEDLVFDLKLKKAGYEFAFVPEALVLWDARPNLTAFAKQYYRYARGDGQALLWPRRHFARYASYGLGLLLLKRSLRGSRSAASTLILGHAVYLNKFLRRILKSQRLLKARVIPAVLVLPLVVTVGDVAKMAGYPAGRLQRIRVARCAD